jgi:hypothetical protein
MFEIKFFFYIIFLKKPTQVKQEQAKLYLLISFIFQ